MAVRLNKTSAISILAINLMPLIDVLFMLLIFFLVTTRFAKADREIEVDLPTASIAVPVTEEPQEVLIGIDKDGLYFVNSKVLSIDELEGVLQQLATDNPANQSVLIRADRRVLLQFPVAAMDLCNRFGIRYTLNTAGDER